MRTGVVLVVYQERPPICLCLTQVCGPRRNPAPRLEGSPGPLAATTQVDAERQYYTQQETWHVRPRVCVRFFLTALENLLVLVGMKAEE